MPVVGMALNKGTNPMKEKTMKEPSPEEQAESRRDVPPGIETTDALEKATRKGGAK